MSRAPFKVNALILFLLLMVSPVWAHPGRTDANGCHTDRKTGLKHCHDQNKVSTTSSYSQKNQFYEGQVQSVADGDTITVRTTDFEQIKVRLYGIDAPEKNQAHGLESGNYLRKLINGKNVEIEVIDEDRYSRLVGLVKLDDKLANLALVQAGLAWVYPQYCKIADICQSLKEAEAQAKLNKQGLWQEDNPTPPWQWRRQK